MKSNKFFSPALLLLAAAIWGFAFAAQDAANIDVFTLGFSRSILAGMFLFAVVLIFDKTKRNGRALISKKGIDISKNELISGAVCGVILTVATMFQQLGINRGTDGGKAAFITALYVVIVPVYALFLKKKASLNIWISIVIAIIGFYLLCIKNDFTLVGSDALVLVCALIFPIHILTIDHFSPKCDGIRMSMIQFFVSAVLNLILALIFEYPINFGAVLDNILPILYLGICSSGIAYTLQIIGQRNIDPTVATIILSLESVFGIIGTAIFLGQSLTPREYAGCAIVLAAVIISNVDFTKIIRRKAKYKNEN